jgi:hypothetical protein
LHDNSNLLLTFALQTVYNGEMFDILQLIPGKKRRSGNGWISFNALCCDSFGHSKDRRYRGGLKLDSEDWAYNCFNCGYTCNFNVGRPISPRARRLLEWCGCEPEQIQKWSLESIRRRDVLDIELPKPKNITVKFSEKNLPDAEILNLADPRHARYVEYLYKRGLDPAAYPYMVTPDDQGRNADRIIVPYTFKDKIVGHTSRYLDSKKPKYINDQQPGYVFGYDFQHDDYGVCIVVEGIFDALSIGGCALMHSTISTEQERTLRSLNRKIIVVPDRDKSGLAICDRVLELGWNISIPSWHSDVKDVNDAVNKYGRFPTLLSILQSATTNKIKIELCRRKLVE